MHRRKSPHVSFVSFFKATRPQTSWPTSAGIPEIGEWLDQRHSFKEVRRVEVGIRSTQSLQNPLIKEYTLNYNRIPYMI